MLESEARLRRDVAGLLEALRERGEGRYAAVFDASAVVASSPAQADEPALRRLLDSHAAQLLGLPAALQAGAELSDLFAAWTSDEFLLAVLNGRVGVLIACPDAQRLEADAGPLLRALADRLLRLDPAWRVDERGRGLFFGSPRLDTVVIPRPADDRST